MASGPITSWQIDGETMETVTEFIFLGSKITADSDCIHFTKRCLLLGRKAMTNLDSGNKGPYSRSYGFSSSHIWMWELNHKEGWALKNWCFQIVVLEKTWESLEQQRSNQSILKEINPECSLEELMLKLKLQQFSHLRWRADSFGKDPDVGKDWG